MTPRVSVIIVTYNSAKWLPRCLESLRAQTIADKVEVLLVDNNSSESQEVELGYLPQNARYVQTGSNLGFVANNLGAQKARGKYLLLLNPDTWLESDCLEELYWTAEHSDADIVGSAVTSYTGNEFVAGGAEAFDLAAQPIEAGSRLYSDLLAFAGFCFIRRDWFFHVGQLNDNFFMYGEEWDLCWRTWLAGGNIMREPWAIIHHAGSTGTSACKRFLANRNAMLTTLCNAQHVLLLTLLPLALLTVAEALWFSVTRIDWRWFKRAGLEPFADLWRLRGEIRKKRNYNHFVRERGDWFMLRFLRLGFARWTNRPRPRRNEDKELMATIEKWRGA